MGLEFHQEKPRYFKMQHDNATAYVLPFIHEITPLKPGMNVLEIGCAEGGVLSAFLAAGCQGTGVELSPTRAANAKQFLAEYLETGQARIESKNIYDAQIPADFPEPFDVIVLKDVIEHIHDQERLLRRMQDFLKPGGHIFFGFPPWQMPYGGHQQIGKGKLAKLPYYHLLPRPVYRGVLKLFQQSEGTINELMEIQETRISLERFERILRTTGYATVRKQLYLVNPIYKYKFGLKPRKQNKVVGAIPWLRNFVTTCGFYLVTPSQSPT
ncbi:MAG: class I SAM-dependent methyltransferase [Bacteroidota bacterium]